MASLLALSLVACSGKKDAHAPANAEQAHGGSPVSKWTYDGDTGPAHWAQLGGASAICGAGQRQSPVDIVGQPQMQFSHILLNYNSVTATIQNTGKTVRVVPANGGDLELDGAR
jgi:carbonic anhydrase